MTGSISIQFQFDSGSIHREPIFMHTTTFHRAEATSTIASIRILGRNTLHNKDFCKKMVPRNNFPK